MTAKIVTILLIQTFLAMDFTLAQNVSFHYQECSNLSPHLAIEKDVFKHIFSRIYSPEHEFRNRALKNEIITGNVVRISRKQNRTYQAQPEKYKGEKISKEIESKLDTEAQRLLRKLSDRMEEARSSYLLKVVIRDVEHFKHYSEKEREKLIFIVQNVDLLVVKNRFTLHDRGTYAHTRRGNYLETGKLEDSAIWLGEKTVLELTIAELAQFLIEEAQHILKPYATHYNPKNSTGTIKHSDRLFANLIFLSNFRGREFPPSFFCETDMVGLGLSLRLVMTQKVSLAQKVEQKLEQELMLCLVQKIVLESEYKYLERIIPVIWEKASKDPKGSRVRTYKKLTKFFRTQIGSKSLNYDFEFAAVKKKDYENEKEFERILKGLRGFAFYSRKYKRYFLIVDGDFFPEKFIDFAAIHEFGEQLFDDHGKATKLEFAICKHKRKLGAYLQWLERNYPEKFANVFTYAGDNIVAKSVKETEEYERMRQECRDSSEYEFAEALIDAFKWPQRAVKMFYSYQRRQKEAEEILLRALRKIDKMAGHWEYRPIADFHVIVRMLNGMFVNAIDELIQNDLIFGLDLERIEELIRQESQNYTISRRLHRMWDEYKKFKNLETKIPDLLMINEWAMIKRAKFVRLNVDHYEIVKELRAEQEKVKPGQIPDANLMLKFDEIAEVIINNQEGFLQTKELQSLEPLSLKMVSEELKNKGIDLTPGKVKEILRNAREAGIDKIMYRGVYFQIDLLTKSRKEFLQIQVADILEKMLAEVDFNLDEFRKDNPGVPEKLVYKVMLRTNEKITPQAAKKYIAEFVSKKLKLGVKLPQISEALKSKISDPEIRFIWQAI